MTSPFNAYSRSVDSPAVSGAVITPSNDTDLTTWVRAITIGTDAGVLVYDNWEGTTCTTGPLPVGTHPIFARRVRATGTTATGLTGWA